jgi:hypothetical protein
MIEPHEKAPLSLAGLQMVRCQCGRYVGLPLAGKVRCPCGKVHSCWADYLLLHSKRDMPCDPTPGMGIGDRVSGIGYRVGRYPVPDPRSPIPVPPLPERGEDRELG